MTVELIIQHGEKVYEPVVTEGITWKTERKNSPGELDFTVVDDGKIPFSEGDAVRLRVDGHNVFYGFIFTKKSDKNRNIKVTAYDQLRYLKNKDTYVYANKTAGELIKMIADDFGLRIGGLEDTGYRIPSRVESDKTLFDIIQNALDQTLQAKGYLYVLYDDFGKLTLKGLDEMRLDLLIDEETAEDYDYTSSIDDETYNQIKLAYDNDETGKREIYMAKSSKNINSWGVLQFYEKIEKGEDGKKKADALLSLYNHKKKQLSIKNAFGDHRVRAGSMVVVMLDLGDIKIKNLMLVEKCKHEYKNNQHFMALNLRGGDFNA